MKTYFLNINNILKIQINNHNPKYKNIFLNIFKHYENFVTEKLDECDLIINLNKINVNKDNLTYQNNKIFISEDYLGVINEEYKHAKWSFELHHLEQTPTILNIDYSILGAIFITGDVIDFVIQYKLQQKDSILIHASSVYKETRSITFPSRGGGGKTTMAMKFVNIGFKLLGDNYILLNRTQTESYPTSLSLFSYNLTEAIKQQLTTQEKIRLVFNQAIYTISFGYAKFFLKVNPLKLGEIGKNSSLQNIYVLIPSMKADTLRVEPMDRADLVNYMVNNQKLEFPLFNEYLDIFSYFNPRSGLSNFWVNYQKILESNLEQRNQYNVVFIGKQKYDALFNQIRDTPA